MRAVILAGGRGMRLRPYTAVLPKPLVPIGNRPILEHIIHQLAAAGIDAVDICVGHLGQLIHVYFSQYDTLPENLEVRWHWEDEPLGTAGALRQLPDLGETFLAMNGDILTTLDYQELLSFHTAQQALLTVAMHRKQVDIDLGVIECDGTSVTGYREKPSLVYDVSMGIYVYQRRALAYLPEGFCTFPDLVLRLLSAGEKVAAYRSQADWYDIGTLAEYERATQEVAQRPEAFGLNVEP